ncbi:solute carrier family 2, facilitated glucose transporter member 8 isoform X1 [Lampetra fluviatilis]
MEEWGGVIGAAAGEASDSMKEPLLGSRGGGGGSGGRLEERGGDYEEDEEGEGELDPHVVEQYYSKVQNGRLYLAVLSTALGPLSLGLTLGYSSPAIPDLERSPEAQLRLSPAQVSWFGSLVTIGAVLAGPLAGLLVERLGRKPTLMLSAVPFVVGWLLLVTAQSPAALYAGRTLTGLAGGTASLVVPVYISEVSHPAVRGALGSCMQLMVVLGIFTAYAAGLILGWRWLAVLCAVPPTLMLLLLVAVVPESPRFLLSRPRRRAEAVAALTVLRGDAVDVRTEIRLIRQGQQQQQQERLSWRELRMPVLYKPLAVTVLLMTLQQFSGINAVMLYAESIFRAAHIQNSAEAPVIIAAVQVGVTLLSGFLMDRAGRKLLLCLSGVIMAASAATFGAYFKLTGSGGNGTLGALDLALPYAGGAPDHGLAMEGAASTGSLGWLALASMLLYIVGFSLGWGPIPWIVMSEVFPVRWRGVASGVCVAVNWISAFVVTKEFHDFSEWLGFPGAFWFFASVCAAGFVLTIVALPETKGRSLEQIQAHFEGRPSPPSPPPPPLAASSTPAAAASAAAAGAAAGSLGQAAVTGAGGELSAQEP